MKKIITLSSTIVLMLCIAVSVAVSSSAAGTSIANATQIYMGTTYSDSITETGREDYYKFTLSSAGRVMINFTSYMENYCIYIYDQTGEQVWGKEENKWVSTTGMRKDSFNIDLIKGTYFVKVTGYAWYINYPSTGNYNFNISFVTSYESSNEYNNSIIDSYAVNFNELIKGQIAENDREDYYKILLPSAGKITIDLTAYLKNYCIYLYDESGEEVWNKEENKWIETTGTRSDIYKIDLTKGTYYIKITGYAWYINYPSTGN
ncbi:MAG: hypothetical protein IJB74_04880, partial [Clostridia bacterium]|nr:hypothetical protein [Clostridia bacterium]